MKKFWNNVWGWIRPYLTWKMAPSLAIAWLITNGWAYVFIAVGPALHLKWMTLAGSTWAFILWLPFTIEKPITIAIALFIHKKIFLKKGEEYATQKGEKSRSDITQYQERNQGGKTSQTSHSDCLNEG